MSEDLYTTHAREKYSLPPEWNAYRWACQPPGGDEVLYYEISGAVAPIKRDGNRNWRKMDKGTDRTITIPKPEHEAWVNAWSEKTGKCVPCTGEGKVIESWSAKNGTKFRTCPKCNGTGKRPTDLPPAPSAHLSSHQAEPTGAGRI